MTLANSATVSKRWYQALHVQDLVGINRHVLGAAGKEIFSTSDDED